MKEVLIFTLIIALIIALWKELNMHWLKEKGLILLKYLWRSKYNQIMVDRAIVAHEEDEDYKHPEVEPIELNLDPEAVAKQIEKDLQKQMENRNARRD